MFVDWFEEWCHTDRQSAVDQVSILSGLGFSLTIGSIYCYFVRVDVSSFFAATILIKTFKYLFCIL